MHRIIFFGTSEFAVPSLRSLLNDSRFEIVGLVTQPDRPVGRHAVMTAPPVKTIFNGPVLQPEKMSDPDFRTQTEKLGGDCDAFVVISYGKILPAWLLNLPKKGSINIHGSLLPRWRGAAPIQAAIAAGDTASGVTIMKIDEALDHGPILAIAEELIRETDSGGQLHDRLAELGGKMLPDILADYLDGKIQPREQDHDLATNCRTLTRDDGKLNFTKTSQELERQIRAYTPWPGTWMEWNGKRLKILEAKIAKDTDGKPGEILVNDRKPVLVCAKGTALELISVQPEGKKAMSGIDFSSGVRI